MPVTIIQRESAAPNQDKHKQLIRVIEDVVRVDAVAGIKETIAIQEQRVAKLRKHESRLPYLLSQLTNETKLLEGMYYDVLKFQTSATVLAHLRQDLEGGDLLGEVTDLSLDIANKQEVHAATMKALALLQVIES